MKRWTAILSVAALVLGLLAPGGEAFAKAKKQKYYDFEDITDRYAISADIKMDGYGDGFHSKLVFVAKPESGISFGIQYDKDALPPYTSKYSLIVEDIYSNQPGWQFYFRPSTIELKKGKFYNLMMSLNKKGYFSVYFDHHKIGTYYNERMAGKLVYPRVEGCGKHNGDIVLTEFKNIDLKIGPYDLIDLYTPYRLDTAPMIKSRIKSRSRVLIQGHLNGLLPFQDWDSAYEDVSGIVQYHLEDVEDSDFDYGF